MRLGTDGIKGKKRRIAPGLWLCVFVAAAALLPYHMETAHAAEKEDGFFEIVEQKEDETDGNSQQTIPSGRQKPLLVDEADLLDEIEESALLSDLEDLSEKERMDVAIVTVNGLDGKSAEAYADDYYDYNGYGQGKDKDGVLLLVSMADRDWQVTTTGFGIEAVNDAAIRLISDRVVPDLSRGDYYQAFYGYCRTVEKVADMAREGTPYSDGGSGSVRMPVQTRVAGCAVGAVILGLIIGMIVTGRQKARLKSVRRQSSANAYIYGEASHLDVSEDRFLHRNVVKTRIERDDNRGGGGSTIHMGSSGTSHGGGGGKF